MIAEKVELLAVLLYLVTVLDDGFANLFLHVFGFVKLYVELDVFVVELGDVILVLINLLTYLYQLLVFELSERLVVELVVRSKFF